MESGNNSCGFVDMGVQQQSYQQKGALQKKVSDKETLCPFFRLVGELEPIPEVIRRGQDNSLGH